MNNTQNLPYIPIPEPAPVCEGFAELDTSLKVDDTKRKSSVPKICCEAPEEKVGGFSLGQTVDMVNKPPHYNQGGMETIKILKAKLTPEEFRGFCLGNIIKYVTRAPYKNGVEDYRKAEYYLKELIKEAKK